jgi:hypothetical protein
MMNQEFTTKSGVKVRAMEAESSGGLIELDLKEIKQTADGTYLIPSKDLQAAGKWAFTIDVAQMKKEGKPVPPEMEKDIDKNAMFLHEIMQQVPTILDLVRQIKNDRVHPIERGLEKGLIEASAELTQEILASDRELKEKLTEDLRGNLEKMLSDEGEGEEGEEE